MRCFHCYPKVYCTTKYCACRGFGKILKVHFELRDTQDMVKKIVCDPLLTWPAQVSYIFGVGRGVQI